MKKMMTLTICAVVALSITACASSGAAAKTPITETTAITKSTTPMNTSPDTMIDNHFVDCQTMEAAAEVGVNLKEGYNGDLSSREAGSVGGQMVKKMIESYEKNL